MPGFVFVADAQDIAGKKRLLECDTGAAVFFRNMTHTESGAGLPFYLNGIQGPLRQKTVMGSGTAQGAREQVKRFFSKMRILNMIPEQLIRPYRVVHIMGAFFAAFDFPCPNRRNRPKDFDQDIQAEILTGKKTILCSAPAYKAACRAERIFPSGRFYPQKNCSSSICRRPRNTGRRERKFPGRCFQDRFRRSA